MTRRRPRRHRGGRQSEEELALADESHESLFFDEGAEGEFDYEFEDVPETSGRWKHFVTVAVVFGLVAVVLVVYSNMGDSDAEKTDGEAPVVTEQKDEEALGRDGRTPARGRRRAGGRAIRPDRARSRRSRSPGGGDSQCRERRASRHATGRDVCDGDRPGRRRRTGLH